MIACFGRITSKRASQTELVKLPTDPNSDCCPVKRISGDHVSFARNSNCRDRHESPLHLLVSQSPPYALRVAAKASWPAMSVAVTNVQLQLCVTLVVLYILTREFPP